MDCDIKIYKSVFHSVDEIANGIQHGKVEDYQMEPGEFYGEWTQIVSPQVTLGIHKFNHKIFRKGTSKKGHTVFLFPSDIASVLKMHEFGNSNIQIGLIKSGMHRCSIMPKNFFGTPISLNNDYLAELILKLNYEKTLFKRIQQNVSLEISRENGCKIRKLMMELYNSELIDKKKLTIELPLLLIKSLNETSGKLQKKTTNTRKAIFHKSLNYIEQNIEQPLRLKDIYTHVDTSERNLRYIFNDLAELSPKKVINYLKLNKARKDIINSRDDRRITDIANKWGFNHSGQFAADYKKLFGEYPTETASRFKLLNQR